MNASLSARQDHLIKLVYIQHWSDALQELQFPILFIRRTIAIALEATTMLLLPLWNLAATQRNRVGFYIYFSHRRALELLQDIKWLLLVSKAFTLLNCRSGLNSSREQLHRTSPTVEQCFRRATLQCTGSVRESMPC